MTTQPVCARLFRYKSLSLVILAWGTVSCSGTGSGRDDDTLGDSGSSDVVTSDGDATENPQDFGRNDADNVVPDQRDASDLRVDSGRDDPDASMSDTPGDVVDPPTRELVAEPSDVALHFVVNTQDFSYPDESLATVARLLELHEAAEIPLDVYVTDNELALLEDNPELLDSLLVSPWIAMGYHIRPPKPYRTGFDWAGLSEMGSEEVRSVIDDYEHHVTDLEWGTPTEREGGLARLAELVGDSPIPVGAASDPELTGDVGAVFDDLGADFFASHSYPNNVGDRDSRGYLVRPEHVQVILINVWEPDHGPGGCDQEWEADGGSLVDDAIEIACDSPRAVRPCIVSVKIHDNDMFACDSAWTTVYARADQPPYAVARRSDLLEDTEQQRRWDVYEQALNRAVSLRDTTPSVSIRDVAAWIDD